MRPKSKWLDRKSARKNENKNSLPAPPTSIFKVPRGPRLDFNTFWRPLAAATFTIRHWEEATTSVKNRVVSGWTDQIVRFSWSHTCVGIDEIRSPCCHFPKYYRREWSLYITGISTVLLRTSKIILTPPTTISAARAWLNDRSRKFAKHCFATTIPGQKFSKITWINSPRRREQQ